jgi:hypothetical protein
MRVLLVGEAPSRSGGKLRAFDGASGERLAEWARFPFGKYQLLERARTENVLARWPGVGYAGEKGSWFPTALARARARNMYLAEITIFCGRRVAKAFDVEWLPYFHWFDMTWNRQTTTAVVIPHPSGCNRYYNVPENREKAGALLRSVFPDYLP